MTIEGLTDFPVYFIPGNHDHLDGGHEFSQVLFGHPPIGERMHLSFRHGGVHFICPDWGPEEPGGIAPETSPELAAWLEHTLEPGEPTVILAHYPPVFLSQRWRPNLTPTCLERFWRVLEGREEILGIFVGHTHQTFQAKVEGHLIHGVGSTGYQLILQNGVHVWALLPPVYQVVTVHAGGIATEVCRVELPKEDDLAPRGLGG
jgi:hypothetical protein